MAEEAGASAADMYKQYARDARAHGRSPGAQADGGGEEAELPPQTGEYVKDIKHLEEKCAELQSANRQLTIQVQRAEVPNPSSVVRL